MTRSNRQLTQFAIRKVTEYLHKGPSEFRNEIQGNTEVEYHKCDSVGCTSRTVRVKLFGEAILTLMISPTDPKVPSGIILSGGNFYDSKGRPSRTTRERLNGLLDSLGTFNFIPNGIRAFIDKDTGECRVGSEHGSRPFGEQLDTIVILSNPHSLVFS